MISLTCSVVAGLTTQKGWSPGKDGCELHSEPECEARSEASVEMFSWPTMSRKSAQAASRLVGAVLCCGGCVSESGRVEVDGGGAGICVPKI